MMAPPLAPVVHNKTFVQHMRRAGGAFSEPALLKPKYLEPMAASRAMQPERSYRRPKDHQGLRFHAHSDPLPEPTNSMCSTMHRTWLDRHAVDRDEHLHPAYHAYRRVDEAGEAVLAAHLVAADDTRQLQRVATCLAAPALQLRLNTPPTQVRHLRAWAGSDRVNSCLRESTPWREQDAQRELKKLAATRQGKMASGLQGRRLPNPRQGERSLEAATPVHGPMRAELSFAMTLQTHRLETVEAMA